MEQPPPLPRSPAPKRRKGVYLVIGGGLLVVGLACYIIIRLIVSSGITKGPDALFGDQHLKTTVALIELHKLRYGRYPDTLKDLRFTGQWDQIALGSVRYTPNSLRTAYYLDVQRGWIGKPNLKMPEEFWQGTGYSKALAPP